MAAVGSSSSSGLSYPHLVQALAASFPDIVGAQSGDADASASAGASAPPLTVDDAVAAAEMASFVNAKNGDCPFCKMKLAGSSRPIAILPCGHAYHTFCGRSFLQKGDGQECTEPSCHRDAEDVLKSRMREAVLDAAQKGRFDLAALQDPMQAPTVQVQIMELMREAGMPFEGTAIEEVSLSAAREADKQTRTEQAYRERWMASDIGKQGFNMKQRRVLLGPYMNMVQYTRHDSHIKMHTLYALEEQKRRDEAADDHEAATTAFLTTDSATSPYKVTEPDDRMRRRLPLAKMFEAGIRLSDLYFLLGVNTWQTLKAMGLSKSMLSNREGAVPLVPLMDLYNVPFAVVQKDLGILAEDLVRSQISADDLQRAGVHFPLLQMRMGLTKELMAQFRFTPAEWNKQLRMDKRFLFRPVDFKTADFANFGWAPDVFQHAFGLNDLEMRHILEIVTAPSQDSAPMSAAYAPSAPDYDQVAHLHGVPVQTLRGPVTDDVPVI